MPVLARTADWLEDSRVQEDAMDAHLLAEGVTTDPLMTLKLLAHVGGLRRGHQGSDAETVTWSVVSETPGPQPMQAPHPGWMTSTPACA